ncbi:hypothetical protein KRP22_001295 [Phytophthora ramorum]|nr:Troponin C, skeletal muscle [Phytophthora ramorum]
MSSCEIPAEFRSFFTPAQAEELAAQFRISDADGSGSIDEKEFRALLARMGLPISAAEADALVSSIDVDGDGLLDFRELVQMVVRLQKGDAKLAALKKFVETLDTTPVALLEREAVKFGLQVVYQVLENEEETPVTLDADPPASYQMQLDLLGKVCGPTGRETVKASGKTTREAKFRAAEAALVKIKKLQPGLAVEPGELPLEWERWMFGNIERGVSAKKLMQTLAQKGFLLTGNVQLMQRISTRASSYRLRTKRGVSYEHLLQKAYDTIMKSKLRENERRRYHFSWLFESVRWLHAELFTNGSDYTRICKMPVPQKGFIDYLVLRYHKDLRKRGVHDEVASADDGESEEGDEGTADEQARRRKEGDPADWLSLEDMSFFLDTCLRENYKHLPNLQGRTALHVACDENLVCTHERVIQCLAEKHGCSSFLLDHSGKAPLQLLLACRGRPGSPKGDANHEKVVTQQRVERIHAKEARLEDERIIHQRQVWQDELDRMSRDFNDLDTLNRMRKLVKENDGTPVARTSGWNIYEEPLSHNRLFENTRSGFVQRQVPPQLAEEGRTRLAWKEKMETDARFVERHRLQPEWELHRVNGTDVYFFFNRETEQCQWVSPEGVSIREWRTKRFFESVEQLEDEPDQASLVIQFSGIASGPIVDNAVKGRTLGEWRELQGFGGVTFYLHSVDKTIVIDKPDEVLRYEGYRYAQTLIVERSEEIETHDRGWHRYYDPQTSQTFYLNELSGDCVQDTYATKEFLHDIHRPKRQARFALTTEELRRRREEQEWKSALQRARRHDEHLKTAEKENDMATEQQKREKEELETALRQLESSVTVHEYKVPRDVKALKLQAWGAGGGSGLLRNQSVGHGGGGAFVEGICPVFPGETLYFSVGSGGSGGKFARMIESPDEDGDDIETGKKTKKIPGGILIATQVSSAAGGFPGGGTGHSGNKESACGGGGGFTSIYRQGAYGIEYILVAAGGGGGGTCRNGGGGGNCKTRKPQEGDDIRCGRPGGDVAGGSAGVCDEFNPICKFVGTSGGSVQGGDGAEFGGGGGGGLFGGGGGGFSPGIVGGGGGGSSFVSPNLLTAKSVRVDAGVVVKPGGMDQNPPQSVREAYWDLVDGVAGEGGTGSMQTTARGNHGGVRIARFGFFDDMKFHR